jgi:hypothetical protein
VRELLDPLDLPGLVHDTEADSPSTTMPVDDVVQNVHETPVLV